MNVLFFFSFQVWAIEAILKLGDIIVNRVHPGRLPRCMKYESTAITVSKSLQLKDILEDPEVRFKLFIDNIESARLKIL